MPRRIMRAGLTEAEQNNELHSLVDSALNSNQSEGKVVADLVDELLSDMPENAPYDYELIASSMDELMEWAQAFKNVAHMRGGR